MIRKSFVNYVFSKISNQDKTLLKLSFMTHCKPSINEKALWLSTSLESCFYFRQHLQCLLLLFRKVISRSAPAHELLEGISMKMTFSFTTSQNFFRSLSFLSLFMAGNFFGKSIIVSCNWKVEFAQANQHGIITHFFKTEAWYIINFKIRLINSFWPTTWHTFQNHLW